MICDVNERDLCVVANKLCQMNLHKTDSKTKK